jgi:hypothetical protein
VDPDAKNIYGSLSLVKSAVLRLLLPALKRGRQEQQLRERTLCRYKTNKIGLSCTVSPPPQKKNLSVNVVDWCRFDTDLDPVTDPNFNFDANPDLDP